MIVKKYKYMINSILFSAVNSKATLLAVRGLPFALADNVAKKDHNCNSSSKEDNRKDGKEYDICCFCRFADRFFYLPVACT